MEEEILVHLTYSQVYQSRSHICLAFTTCVKLKVSKLHLTSRMDAMLILCTLNIFYPCPCILIGSVCVILLLKVHNGIFTLYILAVKYTPNVIWC